MRASTRTVTLSCTTTGALGVGSSFTVTAVVQPLAAGTLTSTASIVAGATGAVPVDPNPANDSAIATTVVTGTSPPPPTNCHPSYPTVCIPLPPPDLDCGQIPHRNFQVIYTVPNPDLHNLARSRSPSTAAAVGVSTSPVSATSSWQRDARLATAEGRQTARTMPTDACDFSTRRRLR